MAKKDFSLEYIFERFEEKIGRSSLNLERICFADGKGDVKKVQRDGGDRELAKILAYSIRAGEGGLELFQC